MAEPAGRQVYTLFRRWRWVSLTVLYIMRSSAEPVIVNVLRVSPRRQ